MFAAAPPIPIAPVETPKPPVSAQIRLDKKHPLAIRWMHWVNFPVLFTMIWSGLLIYWNDSDNAYKHPHAVYRVGVGPFTLVRFFPQWFWKAMDAPYHVTQGLGYHFFFMWIFAINGILYVLFTILSGEWRFVVPDRKSLIEAIQVTLKDLHLSKYLPPQTKYNGAQKIAYTSVILMGAGSLITGLSIYKPTQAHWLTTVVGRLRDGAVGAFPAHDGILRILRDSRDPGGAGGLEQLPQHGERTGSEIDPGTVSRSGKKELGMSDLDDKQAEEAEQQAADEAVLRESRKHTRRSFAIAAAAAAAGWGVYEWIDGSQRLSMQPTPFRRAFQANARLSRTIFDDRALAPTYPAQAG